MITNVNPANLWYYEPLTGSQCTGDEPFEVLHELQTLLVDTMLEGTTLHEKNSVKLFVVTAEDKRGWMYLPLDVVEETIPFLILDDRIEAMGLTMHGAKI